MKYGRAVAGRQKGFTLIELMIVLVILAIITSIAATVFSDSSDEAARAQAMAELTSLNDAMARYYQSNFNYDTDLDTLRGITGGGPKITETPEFAVELVVTGGGQGYRLVSEPRAGSGITGYYSIDNLGNRCTAAGCPEGSTW